MKPELNPIAKAIFPEAQAAIEQNKCPFCNTYVSENSFSDSLSLKEYGISGLCQTCQDQMFGKR